MGNLEVIAHLKIRPGQLEGFKTQVAEILRVTREQDTHTLRTDWFISGDGTECEVHEMFPNEEGLIEHSMHIMDARAVLFQDYAYDHHATIYGEVSQNFINLVTERMGAPTVYAYLAGATRQQPPYLHPPVTASIRFGFLRSGCAGLSGSCAGLRGG